MLSKLSGKTTWISLLYCISLIYVCYIRFIVCGISRYNGQFLHFKSIWSVFKNVTVMKKTIKADRTPPVGDDLGIFVWEDWFSERWLLNSVKVFYIWTKSKFIESLFYILFYSFLLPPLVYLILFRKIGRDKRVLTLVYYCVCIFIFLFLEEYVRIIRGKIKYPLFTLLEYTFFVILIFQQIKFRMLKLILVILSVSFFLFQILYYFSDNEKKFDSIPIGFEAILIFIFIFFFLYEQLKEAKSQPIYSHYFFWISIGLFIYLGGSFFIYILANSISDQEILKYWFFTYVVEIIKNLLFATALLIYSKNPIKKNLKQPLPDLDFT